MLFHESSVTLLCPCSGGEGAGGDLTESCNIVLGVAEGIARREDVALGHKDGISAD